MIRFVAELSLIMLTLMLQINLRTIDLVTDRLQLSPELFRLQG